MVCFFFVFAFDAFFHLADSSGWLFFGLDCFFFVFWLFSFDIQLANDARSVLEESDQLSPVGLPIGSGSSKGGSTGSGLRCSTSGAFFSSTVMLFATGSLTSLVAVWLFSATMLALAGEF
ncbi:MAG: hypothetical protein IPL73_04865 [Candidatus Obscuribacter sp.]|nr:hypothetical protein [Candidatus Obscuribacter sp.]